MDASELLSLGKKALGDKVWGAEAVLHVGVELATAVNSLKNVSGADKSELVCQTILKLLDDGEKAEKELSGGSTETGKTKIPWNECRSVVKNVLPTALHLVVKASRGEIQLPAVLNALPGLKNLQVPPIVSSCFSAVWSLFQRVFLKKGGPASSSALDLGSAAAAASASASASASLAGAVASPGVVSLVEKLPELAKDPLAEVRELVARVEKMLKEAQALPEAKAAKEAKEARLQHPPLPPSPELTDVSLPGELPTLAEAPASQ
jgi:hypothetical protein